jgi:hypothetical protein
VTPPPGFRRAVRLAAAAGLALAAAGCGSASEFLFGTATDAPLCPTVSVLRDAQSLTLFREGPGRDLTDVTFQARIADVPATCVYKQEDKAFTGVDVSLQVVVEAERGPADRSRSLSFRYFIAIPQFYPQPQGRSEFAMTVDFPGNRSKLTLPDAPVAITIPLGGNRSGASYEIYVGFVLDEEQIELNRQRQGAR